MKNRAPMLIVLGVVVVAVAGYFFWTGGDSASSPAQPSPDVIAKRSSPGADAASSALQETTKRTAGSSTGGRNKRLTADPDGSKGAVAGDTAKREPRQSKRRTKPRPRKPKGEIEPAAEEESVVKKARKARHK